MRHLLTEYDNKKVDAFISYVNILKSDLDGKTSWAKSVSDNQYSDIFKLEASKGLYIEGDSITLQWRKKLCVSYDYHAYKNRVLAAYPDSIFDFEIVYEGDEFSFEKEEGKVIYSHKIKNPFDNKKVILGAYGIIKNKRGEFIEVLTVNDIAKMKAASKMAYIWNTWYDRMVKKSIIKRICSVAFHDITDDLDRIDNENYNPVYSELEEEISTEIKAAETNEKLTEIYKQYISKNINRKAFIEAIKNRREEI